MLGPGRERMDRLPRRTAALAAVTVQCRRRPTSEPLSGFLEAHGPDMSPGASDTPSTLLGVRYKSGELRDGANWPPSGADNRCMSVASTHGRTSLAPNDARFNSMGCRQQHQKRKGPGGACGLRVQRRPSTETQLICPAKTVKGYRQRCETLHARRRDAASGRKGRLAGKLLVRRIPCTLQLICSRVLPHSIAASDCRPAPWVPGPLSTPRVPLARIRCSCPAHRSTPVLPRSTIEGRGGNNAIQNSAARLHQKHHARAAPPAKLPHPGAGASSGALHMGQAAGRE